MTNERASLSEQGAGRGICDSRVIYWQRYRDDVWRNESSEISDYDEDVSDDCTSNSEDDTSEDSNNSDWMKAENMSMLEDVIVVD